jgi:hypothetical protein
MYVEVVFVSRWKYQRWMRREVFKKMWWVRLRLRCKFHVSLAGTKVERQLHVLADELLSRRVFQQFWRTVKRVFLREVCWNAKPLTVFAEHQHYWTCLSWKPLTNASLCFRDALHLAIPFLPMPHPFSQQWFVAKQNRLSHDMQSAVRHRAMTHWRPTSCSPRKEARAGEEV